MIRLEKHDEIVEAMAKAMCRANRPKNGMFNKEQLDTMFEENWPHHLPLATAALDALLAAVVEKGVGRLAGSYEYASGKHTEASTSLVGVAEVPYSPALILKLVPKP